jgi:hypothetical protein
MPTLGPLPDLDFDSALPSSPPEYGGLTAWLTPDGRVSAVPVSGLTHIGRLAPMPSSATLLPVRITPPMPTTEETWDALVRSIEEVKAGRPPRTELEHALAEAMRRNRERAEQEAQAEISRPTRHDRLASGDDIL